MRPHTAESAGLRLARAEYTPDPEMHEVLACQSSLLVLAPPARKGAACLSATVPLGRSLRTIIVESHLEPGWSAWLNSPPRMVVCDRL